MSIPQSSRKLAWGGVVALVAFLGFALQNCSTGADNVTQTTAPLDLTPSSAPTTESGYGFCTTRGCSDIARACRDLVALGCGDAYAPRSQDGGATSTGGTCIEDNDDTNRDGGDYHDHDGDGDSDSYDGDSKHPVGDDSSHHDGDRKRSDDRDQSHDKDGKHDCSTHCKAGTHRHCTADGFDFDELVATCTNVTEHFLIEDLDDTREASEQRLGKPPAGEELSDGQLFSFYAIETAQCVRRAISCAERLNCMRGRFKASSPATHQPFPPGWNTAPPQPPFWTKPWRGDGPKYPWIDPPWPNGQTQTIAGVDSPSCVRCTIQRCPTFAFRCFGAEGDATECANGDCCAAMRHCVQDCGGYEPNAPPSQFLSCMTQCSQTRPRAPQELADLQQCAAGACQGCEKFDTSVADDGGAP